MAAPPIKHWVTLLTLRSRSTCRQCLHRAVYVKAGRLIGQQVHLLRRRSAFFGTPILPPGMRHNATPVIKTDRSQMRIAPTGTAPRGSAKLGWTLRSLILLGPLLHLLPCGKGAEVDINMRPPAKHSYLAVRALPVMLAQHVDNRWRWTKRSYWAPVTLSVSQAFHHARDKTPWRLLARARNCRSAAVRPFDCPPSSSTLERLSAWLVSSIDCNSPTNFGRSL